MVTTAGTAARALCAAAGRPGAGLAALRQMPDGQDKARTLVRWLRENPNEPFECPVAKP